MTEETKHRRKLEESEAQHRRALEKKEFEHRMRLEEKSMELGEKALGSGIFRAKVGMFLAWPLIIGIVCAGTYLIRNDHDWAGFFLVESALAIVVGAFVLQHIEKLRRTRVPKKIVKQEDGVEE